MVLRGGLGTGTQPSVGGWPRRREIERTRPAPSAADLVPLRVLGGETFVTTNVTKDHKAIRFPPFVRSLSRSRIATPNFGFGAHLASEPNLHVLRFHLLFPCYGRIIFLLWACSACTANLSPTDCYANGFSCGTGPETANSPCFLPVIRGYQGESRARSPSPLGLDPSEFASPASWDGAPATREV